jgi:hypothetical protein
VWPPLFLTKSATREGSAFDRSFPPRWDISELVTCKRRDNDNHKKKGESSRVRALEHGSVTNLCAQAHKKTNGTENKRHAGGDSPMNFETSGAWVKVLASWPFIADCCCSAACPFGLVVFSMAMEGTEHSADCDASAEKER